MCRKCFDLKNVMKKIVKICEESKGGERLLAMDIRSMIIDLIDVKEPILTEALFALDCDPDDPDPYFKGYTTGEVMNWEAPYFTFEVAMKIVEWQCDLKWHGVGGAWYSKDDDAFYWEFEVDDYGDEYEGYRGEEIDGMWLYRIGDGWVWSLADEAYKAWYNQVYGPIPLVW